MSFEVKDRNEEVSAIDRRGFVLLGSSLRWRTFHT